MLSHVSSFGLLGMSAYPLTIEVDVSNGLPAVVLVGLPDNTVRESKERIRSAIKNSGYKFPASRITINFSPAHIKKEGPSFDLATALGILASSGQMNGSRLNDYVILGELGLDGRILPITGALCIAMSTPKETGSRCGIILPQANAAEAALTKRHNIFPVQSLTEVVQFLTDGSAIRPVVGHSPPTRSSPGAYDIDFADVKGQNFVKRGLEVAAAGGHNVLMIGPPGSGKSMLAKRMATILPDMSHEEALETTQVHSLIPSAQRPKGIISTRPFRSVHHTASDVALVGGGSVPRPGEVTLSHNGILFLDELPEFNRNVLEALRQPLEDHYVTISRAYQTIRFPACFMLIGAMNPCPCGYYTDPKKNCTCQSHQIQRYISRISGPLLNRIDIHLEVPSLPSTDLLTPSTSESSAEIKKRTCQARSIQHKRFTNTGITANAQMSHKHIKTFCPLQENVKSILKSAIEELGLSARAYDKILKLTRTIADLEGEETILPAHIAEAIQYRSLDRGWWAA